VTQGKINLHPFTGVAQVQFFWVFQNCASGNPKILTFVEEIFVAR
jgi:hypothetical protein